MCSGPFSPGRRTSGNSKIGSSRPAIPADSRYARVRLNARACRQARPVCGKGATRFMTGGIDFEAEGLLGDLSGEAREARLALLQELAEAGVPLDELKRAGEEGRLSLPAARGVLRGGGGLEHGFLLRLLQALGAPIPEDEEAVYGEADLEAAWRAKRFLEAGLPPEGGLETS